MDRWLILALGSIFAGTLLLHLYTLSLGGPSVPTLRADFDDGPVVVDFNSDRTEGLKPGDRLLSIGGTPVAGLAPIPFQLVAVEALATAADVDVVAQRGAEQVHGRLGINRSWLDFSFLPMVIGFGLVAMLVLRRGRETPDAVPFFVGFMSLAIFQASFETGSRMQIAIGMAFFVVFGITALTGILIWVSGFPQRRTECAMRWRFPPTAAVAFALLWMAPRLDYYFTGVLPAAHYTEITQALNVALFCLIIALLTHNYGLAGPSDRRRGRWVLLGVLVAFVPNILVRTLGALLDRQILDALFALARVFYVAGPVGIWIALTRAEDLDVDRAFGGAISYTLLVVVLAVTGEAIVEPIAGSMAVEVGLDENVGQLLFVAVIAALALPAQRWFQPFVQRVLFRNDAPAATSAAMLVARIAEDQSSTLAELVRTTAERLAEQLDSTSWTTATRGGNGWIIDGAGADTLDGDRLDALLAGLPPAVLALPDDGELTGMADALKAQLVLPIVRGDRCVALIALGATRRGHGYQAAERSVLAAITAQLALRSP